MNSLEKELLEIRERIRGIKKEEFSWKKVRELHETQDTTTDETNKQKVQQQVKSLQEQKENIQTQLDQKKNQQAKLQIDLQKQSSQPPFNWLYAVVPGAILLVVMGIIIAYLVGKKSKNNNNERK